MLSFTEGIVIVTKRRIKVYCKIIVIVGYFLISK